MACFTGVGQFRRQDVAFRVEVEDRGEPGAGTNSGSLDDVYRIRIWIPGYNIPGDARTAADLAKVVCCTNLDPEDRDPNMGAGPATVDDGGNIVHGNIQIHPQLPKSTDGICPPPDTVCPVPLP